MFLKLVGLTKIRWDRSTGEPNQHPACVVCTYETVTILTSPVNTADVTFACPSLVKDPERKKMEKGHGRKNTKK